MALKIRLTRTGRKKLPSYRVVVMQSQKSRDGKYLECLGHYHPLLQGEKKISFQDMDRVNYWISNGAKPTDTVERLIKKYKSVA